MTLTQKLTEPDEAELVAAARRDPRQFGVLYLRYVQPLFRYLYSRSGSQAAAEDLTAQTFLAVLEGLGRYRHDGHFAAWLFSIARNKMADHFRREGSLAALEDAERLPGESDLLQGAIQGERKAALAGLLEALPEDERDLLRLRFTAGLSFGEIGRLQGRSEDAVKKAVYRLLDRMQSQLEEPHA